jgi:hypothetical protein
VNNFNLSSPITNRDWQLLGERKLSVEASLDAGIQTWLTQTLHSLPLHTDFLNRILRSAQHSATRLFQADPVTEFELIHLMVFVPQNYASNGKTWGFFRIEKVGTPGAQTGRYDHSIEFYLYMEG